MKSPIRVIIPLLFISLISLPALAGTQEFSCSPIDNADSGDFSFSEICFNEEWAIFKLGSFETTQYLYQVEFIDDTGIKLIASQDGSTPEITIKFSKAPLSKAFSFSAHFCDFKKSVTISAHPDPRFQDEAPFTAGSFERQSIFHPAFDGA